MSPVKKFICVTAVLLTGLLAGLMLGTAMDQYAAHLLSASAWITGHQITDAFFRRVLPTFFNLTLLTLIAATFAARGSGRWLFGLATVLLILSLLLTLRVEVPMNRQIALWKPAAPPPDWSEVRDNWLSSHFLRTASAVAAFLFATLGLTKMRAVPRY